MKENNTSSTASYFISDEPSMLAWGAKLAKSCANLPTIIFLKGQLGVGKTTLARGFIQGLGYEGAVKSPTYTLVEQYELSDDLTIFHFDLYRIHDPEELEFIGIHDYFARAAIFLIEWPEQAGNLLPLADLSCDIRSAAAGREISIQAMTEHGKTILKLL